MLFHEMAKHLQTKGLNPVNMVQGSSNISYHIIFQLAVSTSFFEAKHLKCLCTFGPCEKCLQEVVQSAAEKQESLPRKAMKSAGPTNQRSSVHPFARIAPRPAGVTS